MKASNLVEVTKPRSQEQRENKQEGSQNELQLSFLNVHVHVAIRSGNYL